ncbi:MAG: putative porin [Planctomycetes bacterium]|nr:putative porin [Planctomycetota bacterium]MCW8136237.1 putative porin [Planctomycetota bacterium]
MLLAACPLFAQDAANDEATMEDLKARLARLQAELSNLRDRITEQERRTLDSELRRESLVNLYGDIGLRYHMLFESQTETFNRPEFRLHLGVFGTAYDLAPLQLRYDLRLTTGAVDGNGKATPTLAWLPLPGFGANPTLAVDRFMVELQFERTLIATAGRFASPYGGTEMLFDRDYHFQGLAEHVRFDRLMSDRWRRIFPRIEVVGVQSYLAQNNIGLPAIDDDRPPVYLGGQFRLDFAPFETMETTKDGKISPDITSEIEFRLAIGAHWYDGEEKFAETLGVGYIPRTTNIRDEDGKVQSQFLLGESYLEVLILRTRRARIVAWGHGVLNFQAARQSRTNGRRNNFAFDAGVSWGMEQFTDRWDFLASFRYFYIQADALVPEFNNEARNTNIKGLEVEFSVRIFPTMTAFGIFTLSERENYELNGFGLPSKDDPSRSAGQSVRMRFGFFVEF